MYLFKAKYFLEREDDDISLAKNKSNFQPPQNRNQTIKYIAKSIENIPTPDTLVVWVAILGFVGTFAA